MFFLYETSNWCVNLAGLLILQHLFRNKKGVDENGESFLVSHDLQVMLFFGELARVYWGMSPPEIWLHDPTEYTKVVVLAEFVFSIVLWSIIAVLTFRQAMCCEVERVPWQFRWPLLTVLSMAMAVPGSLFIEPDEASGVQSHAFPGADVMTVFSLVIDVMAILPQLWVISNAQDEFMSSATRDFVGLLGLARIFRMTFWSLNWLSNFLDGMPLSWLAPFLIPDFIHTAVMGQYVHLWVKKVRKDNCHMGGVCGQIFDEQEEGSQNFIKSFLFLLVDTIRTLLGVIGRVLCFHRRKNSESSGQHKRVAVVNMQSMNPVGENDFNSSSSAYVSVSASKSVYEGAPLMGQVSTTQLTVI